MLPNTVLAHLGQHLRAHYEAPNASIAPGRLTRLLDRLVAALAGQDEALTAEVRAGLLAAVPSLRAYALSLARDRDRADDLVQETLLKGWQHRGRYEPGTNLEGWLTTILRNSFVGVPTRLMRLRSASRRNRKRGLRCKTCRRRWSVFRRSNAKPCCLWP
jgi:hypothetical protein